MFILLIELHPQRSDQRQSPLKLNVDLGQSKSQHSDPPVAPGTQSTGLRLVKCRLAPFIPKLRRSHICVFNFIVYLALGWHLLLALQAI